MRKSEMIRIINDRMYGSRVDRPEEFINEVLDICVENGMLPPVCTSCHNDVPDRYEWDEEIQAKYQAWLRGESNET